MLEFFSKLFDGSDWPPRWHCGRWTEFHGWLYITSDLLIWSAYFSIPLVIIRYISKRQDIKFIRLYFLFAAFILACGSTHFLDAAAFWFPVYRLNALVRLITGILSWITVFYLVKLLPAAFSLKTQSELEKEVEQRKKTEEQSRESEAQIQAIFNAAPDAVIVIDEQGRIIKWNPKAEALFGWTTSEVMGKFLNETIIPARYREAHQRGLERFLTTGDGPVLGKTIEIQALTKKGVEFDVALSISPTLINGRSLFIGFIRDITNQKKGEEKIRQLNAELEQRVEERTDELTKSEKKYRHLFENNPMPMWIMDLETFKFLDVNEAAIGQYGYGREEFLAMTALDIRPERDVALFRQANHSANISPDNYNRGTWKHLKKDGTVIHAEVIAHNISFEGREARFILSNDVTARIKTEEKLKESIKELTDYKYALEESSIVAITDQKGIITYANENFCKISKYSVDELIGRDHRIINSGYHPKEFIRDLWVTIANGKIWRGELRNRAKDGSIYWVDTTIVPFLNEENKPYQYVAIRADITERKRAGEALHESQQLLMAIIDNSETVIYIKNLQGRYLLVNRRFCDLFHLSKEEVLERTDHDIFPRETADAFRAMDERVVAADRTLKEVETAPQDDGLHTYISVKSTLRDEGGKPFGIFGVSTDITELKAVEANLRKSIREISDYKFALDESSIVAITNQKGMITHVNNNFCKISKYHAGELIGQDHRIINSGYHPKEFIRDLWTTIANGRIWKGELKNMAKDGNFYWVDTTIVPFLDEGGKPYQYIAIRADITDRKKVEGELYKLNQELEDRVDLRTIQLEAANKEMEAFTYSVSHDLRAPLRGIIGFTAMLEEDYSSKLDEGARRITTIIKSNTLKMGRLIDDLLAFSRMGRQDIAKTSIDTGTMVKEVISELAPEDSRSDIEWDLGALPSIKGDINTVRQVWVNLISNAIKYSGKKERPYIGIGSFIHEGQTAFFIKDNGAGFNNKYKDKLFNVFQRLHSPEEFEGTGIGLALVTKIISKHGGKVWAEGEVDKGACFYFSLPPG